MSQNIILSPIFGLSEIRLENDNDSKKANILIQSHLYKLNSNLKSFVPAIMANFYAERREVWVSTVIKEVERRYDGDWNEWRWFIKTFDTLVFAETGKGIRVTAVLALEKQVKLEYLSARCNNS